VSSQELYGSSMQSGLSSNQQRRYDVQWSPIRRGVISSCSFDRKVQAHSVLGIATKSGRPPKWMKPASGVSCGLGGKIVSFGTVDKTVAVMEFVEEPELKAAVEGFEAAVANGDYAGFAALKARECADYGDGCQAQLWGFMETMFVSNMREALFQYIGFDKDEIAEKAKVFEEEVDISNLSLAESKATPPMTKIAEETVKKALLVGNFDAAVECCIRAGSLADALVLASCGGAELWAKTQAQYFASEVGKRPFLSIVSAVIHSNLAEYVTSSDPASWYETLAFICTYSSEQDFSVLCEALGDHLEGAGDMASASVCFQCAMNLERAATFWLHQLENLEKSAGGEDYLALHDFVVKVAVFMQAGAQSSGLSEDVANALFRYAKIVADQGLYPSAAKHCKSDSQECKELKDRLYRSKDSQICLQLLGSAPDFPYQYVNVGVAPAASSNNQQTRVAAVDTIKPVAQQQSYARSQNQYQAKQTPKASNGYGSANQGYTRNVQQQPEQTQPQYSQQAVQQSTNQYAAQQAVQQSTVQYPSQQAVQQSTNQYAAQQAVQQVQTPAPAQNESQLPQGWMAVQDPSSGRTYYANQSNGETTWDKPAAVAQGRAATSLASKYGDGFVTSASHPELAAQYGNVGTSNPYSDSSRPGTAVINKMRQAPVSGTFNLQKLSEVADSTQYKTTIDGLLENITSLSALPLGPVEKKQYAEAEKSVAIFSKRLANSDIECEVAEKVGQMVTAIKNKDFASASASHTSLVNSAWKSHKNWLKGFKFLIQLGAKSVQSSRTQDQWAM